MTGQKPKIVVVVGPTSSGKSDLAVRIASTWGGEVVSADSRQVYRGLDIGTGKITQDEMRGVPHHMLDVADPREVFSVSTYRAMASHVITDILSRGKLPVVCGGTGFYIRALVEGLVLPDVPPSDALRDKLSSLSAEKLYDHLMAIDPDYAQVVDAKNPRRLVRAIEIATKLGNVPPLAREDAYHPLYIGIHVHPEMLRMRITQRLHRRIADGMIDEARALQASGLSHERMDELGLEYRFLARYLRGMCTQEEMVYELENESVAYAKRQMTWFRKNTDIHWFPPENYSEVEDTVGIFLQKTGPS